METMFDPLLDRMYTAHRALLEAVEKADDPARLVERVQEMIEEARRAGANVATPQERDYLQSLLNFWGNWVFNHTRLFPNVDLYPAAPNAPRLPSPALQPAPYQSLVGEAPVNARGTGQPFIMASVVSPADGAEATVNESLSLTGMYANLRPGWRVFFMAQDSAGRMVLLDDGYNPDTRPEGGTWQADMPFIPPAPGVYRLGLLIAITAASASALLAARRGGTPLDATPEGVIPLFDLTVIVVR
jgi:hypothetical protein